LKGEGAKSIAECGQGIAEKKRVLHPKERERLANLLQNINKTNMKDADALVSQATSKSSA
jgi:hypothetical protein